MSDRSQHITQRAATHAVQHAAARFFSGTAISRVTGLCRDMAMAYAFGTSAAVALFLMAYRFAHLLRRLLGESNLHAGFIPLFEEMSGNDESQAASFFRDLLWSMTILLIGLIALASPPLLLLSHFSKGTTKEVALLTTCMLPSLAFICLYALNAALLQCKNRYFLTSVAPASFNLVWIVGALLLSRTPPTTAMPWLAGTIVAAAAMQWLVTLPAIAPVLRQATTRRCAFPATVRRLAAPLSLGLLGLAATQVNSAVDVLFARWAEAEGPAYLYFAMRIQQLPLALFGIALAGALLPPLSRAAKSGQRQVGEQLLTHALGRSLQLMIPCTVLLLALGPHTLAFLFARGSFSMSALESCNHCLAAYALGLIPATMVLLHAPAFYAEGDYRTPSLTAIGSVGFNLLLNAWMVMWLGWGAASVALATSFSSWGNALVLQAVRQHRWGGSVLACWARQGSTLLATTGGTAMLLTTSKALGLTPVDIANGSWPATWSAQLTAIILPFLAFLAAGAAILFSIQFAKRAKTRHS